MVSIQNKFNFTGVQNCGKQRVSTFGCFKNNSLNSDDISFKSSENDSDWKKLVPILNFRINCKNFLGGGCEAKVYKINDKHVLRLTEGAKFVVPQKFTSQSDIFEGRNYGQPIVVGSKNVSINKFVEGKPLYEVGKYDTEKYMQTLRKMVNLPQETLEDFVENVAFINSKGYRIDDSNPANFLFDEKTQKIGIVDICKKGTTSLDLYGPYSHFWILNPLVNSHDFLGVYENLDVDDRQEMIDLILKLQDRIIPLCEKYDIPVIEVKEEEQTMFSLATFLSKLDEIDITSTESIFEKLMRMRGY